MDIYYKYAVECEYWLEQASIEADNYVDQSLYDWLFEADTDTENSNNQTKSKTDTFLGNAARAVIKMVENIISNIRNWLHRTFNSGRFKSAQQNLQQSGKGGTQIKTANTSKIKEVWNSIFHKTDEAVKQAQDENNSIPDNDPNANNNNNNGNNNDSGDQTVGEGVDAAISGIEQMVKEKLDGLIGTNGDVTRMGQTWVTTITAEAALRRATTNAQEAENLLTLLENDKNLMKRLERDLGKAKAKSYKKKVKSLSKTISLVRLRAKFRGQYIDSIMDAGNSVLDDVEYIISHKGKNVVGDHVKGVASTALSSTNRREARRRSQLEDQLLGNGNTMRAVRVADQAYRTKEYIRQNSNSNGNTSRTNGFLHNLVFGANN